jgi:hypothetical protein
MWENLNAHWQMKTYTHTCIHTYLHAMNPIQIFFKKEDIIQYEHGCSWSHNSSEMSQSLKYKFCCFCCWVLVLMHCDQIECMG